MGVWPRKRSVGTLVITLNVNNFLTIRFKELEIVSNESCQSQLSNGVFGLAKIGLGRVIEGPERR